MPIEIVIKTKEGPRIDIIGLRKKGLQAHWPGIAVGYTGNLHSGDTVPRHPDRRPKRSTRTHRGGILSRR